MRKKAWKIPRQYSFVKVSDYWMNYLKEFDPDHDPVDALYKEARAHNCFIFFGDIPNQSGHCVVVSVRTGKIHSCYHTEDFEEIPEDET